jgi:hypothetical protein
MEAMKRSYEVSIGRSFFAQSGGGAIMRQQDGTGYQHDDPDKDDDKGGPQPDQEAQPQQQKQPRMLTNLARYNAPGIKDNENLTGKQNQRDRHHLSDEYEKKRDRIAKSDMQHREKQQGMMENIRAEIFAEEQESTSSNATTPTSSQTASQASSRATSPTTSRAT